MDELEPVYQASADRRDHLLAHRLAAAAGDMLRTLRAEAGSADSAGLGGEGDRRSDDFLHSELAAQRPGDAVLSEESLDDLSRLRASRVWIIDPLDGTREFAEPGRTDWAVHVALWADGALAAGAVALPAQGRVLSTLQPGDLGADPQRRVILVSRSRPPALVGRIAEEWRARVLPMGSAGAKTVAVLSGIGSAYLHAGGQFEWDSAAPVAVALAHGLRVRRLDGSPPRYNNPDPALPDLVVCRPSGSDELWAILDDAGAD
ncbi:MAG TPA: 3'(2'),5'-bisphosphate nucleotidase CysQ [Pseudonocardiaceae bacterium]|nr:3'(2'),5'-bisphosphate nucleotidase CysQ [Pseudonocardiaceae bacterium]